MIPISKSLIMFVVLFAFVFFIGASLAGVSLGLLSALLITTGLFFLIKGLTGGSFFGFSPIVTVILGVVVLFVFGGFAFIGGLVGGLTSGAPLATISAPLTAIDQPASVASEDECLAKITNKDIIGKAAALTFNGYDLAADNPFGSAVDIATAVNIFEAKSLSEAGPANFRQNTADTSAGRLTGFKVGEVLTFAGGNGAYYMQPVEGFCVETEEDSLVFDLFSIEAESNIQSVVYDDTATTELSAGTGQTDYTAALGASEVDTYWWRIRNNAANKAYWLGAVGLATLTNVSYAKPGPESAVLFNAVSLPLHMKDVAIEVAAGSAPTVTRSYNPYELKSPVRLTEFKEFKFQIEVKATANDPVASQNTSAQSGICGIAKDKAWNRGEDGKMYHTFYNITSGQEDIGLQETEVSPNGKQTGFCSQFT